MTLSTTTSRADYTGTGSTGPFTVPFRFTANSDLTVIKRVIATGVETVLTLTTDYTVSGAGNATGAVTLVVALGNATETLSILRVVALTQPTSIANGGTFFPSTHEAVFDRLTMVAQQHEDALGRAVKISPTTDPSTVDLTAPAPIANQALGFNAGANGIALIDVDGKDATVLSSAHTYTDTKLSGSLSPTDVQLATDPQDASVRQSIIEYPVLSGEVGVVDIRYRWGNVQRFGAIAGVDATTVLANVFTSAQACGIRHVDFAGLVLTHANPIVASIAQHLTINAFGASIQYTGTGYAWDVSLPTATASPRWTWFGGDFFDGNSGASANGCFKFTDAGGMKFFRTRVINFRRAWRMHNNLRWSENNAWYGCQVSAASTVGAEDPTKLGHAIEFSVETAGVTSPSFARTNVIDIQLSGGVSGGHYFYGHTGANVYDSEFHSVNGNIPASTDPALKTALFYFDGNCRGSSINGIRTEFNGAGAYGYYLFDKGPNCTKYPAILEFETGGGLTDWFVPGFDLTVLQKSAYPGGLSQLAVDKVAVLAGAGAYTADPKADCAINVSGPNDVYLPSTAAVALGRVYGVMRATNSTGDVTIHPATGEKINGSTSPFVLSGPSESVVLVSYGGGAWDIFATGRTRAETNLGNVTGAYTLDWSPSSAGPLYATMVGATTFTFSNLHAGDRLVLHLAGAFVPTWPATVRWPNGITPSPTATAGFEDIYVFVYSAVTGLINGAVLSNYATT